MRKFYEPKYITDKTGRTIDVHDLYPEYKQYKKLSFLRLFIGFTFLAWIRMIGFIILCFILWMSLKILSYKDTKTNKYIGKKLNHWILGTVLWLFGLIDTKKRIQPNDLYSYYLGPGNYSNFDNDYSLIISNHTSWYEILYILGRYVPGFVAKSAVRNAPMIGLISEKIGSLYITRESQENRDLLVKIN